MRALSRTRVYLGSLATLVGCGLIVTGLLTGDELLWRLLLLIGLGLVSLLPRVLEPKLSHERRSARRLIVVCLLAFVAVTLQLARTQILQSATIRNRAAAILQPVSVEDVAAQTPADQRLSLGDDRMQNVTISDLQRGSIFDRTGIPLAENRAGLRVYPMNATAFVTGYFSRLYGMTGVERSYDAYLSGARTISPTAVLEARLLGTPLQSLPADVHLTIDSRLQQIAQTALAGRRGAIVLLDAQTGALLVAAAYPAVNPNSLVIPPDASDQVLADIRLEWERLSTDPASPLLDRAVRGRYAPGSVIKTMTAAAALDTGVLTSTNSLVTCPNRLDTEAGAPPVRNAVENLSERTGDPSDLTRVFAWSCNTAFAQIGIALGPERFGYYASRFGLGYADVPTTPSLRDIAADSGTIAASAGFLEGRAALAATAFGQGEALVTPLDMAQMVAAAATGTLMRPYVVHDVRIGTRTLYVATPTAIRQIVSAETARSVRELLRDSVRFGYAAPAALPTIAVGGKTGTAENPSGAPHSWFVGVAPIDRPQYAIAAIIENGGEGSRGALPVARSVLAAALGVSP